MQIKELYVLNLINEMASAMLNHKVDNEFYDYYMEKDLRLNGKYQPRTETGNIECEPKRTTL